MKKYLFISALLVFPLIFSSCDNDNKPGEEEPPVTKFTLKVTPDDQVTFADTGDEKTITVETNAAKWAAVLETEDHFTLLQTTGKFIVTAPANRTAGEIKTTVTVTAEGTTDKFVIDLVQPNIPIDYEIRVAPEDCYFFFPGGEKTFFITTNVESWTATLNDDSWFTVTQEDTQFVISAPSNSGSTPYSAIVTVSGGTAEPVEIPVYQEGLSEKSFEVMWMPGGEEFEPIPNDPFPPTYHAHTWTAATDDTGTYFNATFYGLLNSVCIRYVENSSDNPLRFDFSFTLEEDLGGVFLVREFVPVIVVDDAIVTLDRSPGTDYSKLIFDPVEYKVYTGEYTHRHTDGKTYPVCYISNELMTMADGTVITEGYGKIFKYFEWTRIEEQ